MCPFREFSSSVGAGTTPATEYQKDPVLHHINQFHCFYSSTLNTWISSFRALGKTRSLLPLNKANTLGIG